MIVIGITGGVGTGKSTVARLFQRRGARRIDADRLAREAMRPGQPAWRRVVRAFGRELAGTGGAIDRPALARRVFSSPRLRKRLEAIVHPAVFRAIRKELARLRAQRRTRVVVVEIPLLFETKAQRLMDRVVVVTAPARVVNARLHARGWTPREISARRAAQMALSAKAALADLVIDNGNGLKRTRTQVTQAWQQLVDATRSKRLA